MKDKAKENDNNGKQMKKLRDQSMDSIVMSPT